MFKQPQLLVSIYSHVELKRIYGCKVNMGVKINESKWMNLFWCSFTWNSLVSLSENPLWSWQGLLENMNMNSSIYLLRFTQLKCLQSVGTVTQRWLKHGTTKAFKISTNVSSLLHKWSNSRRILWTWNMLKYACTCSTIWCGSHRAQRRIVTSMTLQSAGLRLHVRMQSSLFQVASFGWMDG